MLCTCQVILPLTCMFATMCRYKKHLKLSQLLKQLDNELALEYNFEMSVTISKICIMFLSTNKYLLIIFESTNLVIYQLKAHSVRTTLQW